MTRRKRKIKNNAVGAAHVGQYPKQFEQKNRAGYNHDSSCAIRNSQITKKKRPSEELRHVLEIYLCDLLDLFWSEPNL